MMAAWCVRACGLNPLVVYFNVNTHDIWEESMITRCDISRYKRRGDIKEVDITEFRVYVKMISNRLIS